jgi:hypothetical protein
MHERSSQRTSTLSIRRWNDVGLGDAWARAYGSEGG